MVRSPQYRGNISSVGKVISDSGNSLSTLYRQAKALTRVESLLTRNTDPVLANQFQVAAMRQDRLILVTSSATWATRLRMQSGQMLSILHQSGYKHIRHIDLRVAPIHQDPQETRTRRQKSPAAKIALDLMSQLSESNKD